LANYNLVNNNGTQNKGRKTLRSSHQNQNNILSHLPNLQQIQTRHGTKRVTKNAPTIIIASQSTIDHLEKEY